MPELIAKGPWTGRTARQAGGVTLTPLDVAPIWSVALFPGAAKAAAKVLKPLAFAFPPPNGWTGKGAVRLVWTGREQAFLFGAAPPEGLSAHAALTDQSDGWAGLSVTGPGAEAALARLVPVDLRAAAVPPGSALRAPVNHMSALILRDAGGFEVWVFRSMARTLWHELAEVQDRLAARTA